MPETSKGEKGRALDALTRSWKAAVDYMEGATQAVADGARTFQDRFEAGNLLDLSAKTGLVGALLDGYANYFDGMAKVSREVADRFASGAEKKSAETK